MPVKKAAKKKKKATKKAAAKKKPAARKKATAKRKATTRKKAKPVRKAATKKAAAKKKTTKKAAPRKKAAAKKKPAKKKVARKPNPAFMKPMQPDNALAAVVGSKPIPRTEITKKLWAYIKRNSLQNPSNRREIMADAKLRPLFGGKSKVNMFEMTKLVSKHMK
ncbi:MAG: hypothetical protein JSU69_05170 [Candidatus Zixiibacteriota bacterium]|nr:MAG: hypothetical protein JSU69_05170 [candidate division Zixibacteria bacterium]